jgi:hypothetical protein
VLFLAAGAVTGVDILPLKVFQSVELKAPVALVEAKDNDIT